MVYMYKYLRDVIFELLVPASRSAAKFSSSKISLAKLWLASIGEQDTCEWLCVTLAKNDGKFWPYQKLFPPLSMLWLTNQLATLFSQHCVAPIVDCGMANLGAISMQTSWSNIVSRISNSWQWPLSYVTCTYNMLSKKSSQTPQNLKDWWSLKIVSALTKDLLRARLLVNIK